MEQAVLRCGWRKSPCFALVVSSFIEQSLNRATVFKTLLMQFKDMLDQFCLWYEPPRMQCLGLISQPLYNSPAKPLEIRIASYSNWHRDSHWCQACQSRRIMFVRVPSMLHREIQQRQRSTWRLIDLCAGRMPVVRQDYYLEENYRLLVYGLVRHLIVEHVCPCAELSGVNQHHIIPPCLVSLSLFICYLILVWISTNMNSLF